MFTIIIQSVATVGLVWLIYCSWKFYNYFEKDHDVHDILDNNKNKDKVIVIGHQLSSKSILRTLVSDTEDSISIKSYEDVSKKLQEIKAKYGEDAEISIYLHTPGGSLFYSQLIANLIYRWKGPVTAHIIGYAASGGTLIALSCNRIVMSYDSVLGPIDPQATVTDNDSFLSPAISEQYAEEIFEEADATGEKLTSKDYWLTYLRKDIKKTMPVYRAFLLKILRKNYEEERSTELVDFFLKNRSHSMPIFSEECQQIGLKVELVN